MSNFVEMLNDLMQEENINANNLAKKLGCTPSSICSYLSGEYSPLIKSLVEIADYFKCTTDYLLGLESENTSENFLTCPPIGERIKKLVTQKGYSGRRFCRESGIPEGTYFALIAGRAEPNIDSLIKVAKFLNYSVDYVLGREN